MGEHTACVVAFLGYLGIISISSLIGCYILQSAMPLWLFVIPLLTGFQWDALKGE